MTMKKISIDFETFYDKKAGVSISSCGIYAYCRKLLAYGDDAAPLVSIYSDDPELRYIGHPKNAPWEKYDNIPWIAHNAEFDIGIFEFVIRKLYGVAINGPSQIIDTMHLAAYLGVAKSLKHACSALLGIAVDKTQREIQDGRRFSTLSEDQKNEFLQYCGKDAELSWQLWERFGADWPESEQWLSQHAIIRNLEGSRIDVPKLHAAIDRLTAAVLQYEGQLPWVARGEKASSTKQYAEQCVLDGLRPCVDAAGKATTAAKSEEFQTWLEENANKQPWVLALNRYRKCLRTLNILQAFEDNRCGDIVPGTLRYYGAFTGRYSSSGFFNFQNMPRDPIRLDKMNRMIDKYHDAEEDFSINIRNLIIPREGYTFIISDLSQIEPRVMAWLCHDTASLDCFRRGVDAYETHARAYMGYTDPRPLKEVDKHMRTEAKMRVLALGYQAGAQKFVDFSKANGVEMDLPRATQIVQSFKFATRNTTGALWREGDRVLNNHALTGSNYFMRLPSGRILRYYNVRPSSTGRGYQCVKELGAGDKGNVKYLYGGKITENKVQAVARDVLTNALRKVEDKGMRVIFSVHDEIIVEATEDNSTILSKQVKQAMTTPPDWAADLPLDCSCDLSNCYTK